MNVVTGERYKVVLNEVKQYVRGFYGRPPAPIDPKVKKLVIGDEKPLSVRPADLLEPELPKAREALKDIPHVPRDEVSYALFPQYALEFFKRRAERQSVGKTNIEQDIAVMAAVLHMSSHQTAFEQPSAAGGNAWAEAGVGEIIAGRTGQNAPGRWERSPSAWASAGRKDLMKSHEQGEM
jgi:hypothetical protein